MYITIEHCDISEASKLEAEIREATTIKDIYLQEGSGGVFDVTVDKTKIYSKDNTGRFPTNAEILDSIIRYDLGKPTCGL
jgi:predicted Rdx family selenoprotein